MAAPKANPAKVDFIESNPKTVVLVIGWFYIITSLWHIIEFSLIKNWYYDLFSYMPYWLKLVRYSFSWFQRIFVIVVAIGLIRFKDIYRKILIGFCVFVMATLYWKHPYAGFLELTRELDRKYGHLLVMPPELHIKITFESLVIPSIIGHYILDIAFCCTVIYLLTREPVKKLFNK